MKNVVRNAKGQFVSIFLLATAVAGITLAIINMNEKTEAEAAEKAFEKASEDADEWIKREDKKISDEAAKSADDLAVLNGTMTKLQAKQNEAGRKAMAENIEQEYYGKRSALLRAAEEVEKRTRTDHNYTLSEEAKKAYANLEKFDKEYEEGKKKLIQNTAHESIRIDNKAEEEERSRKGCKGSPRQSKKITE